MNKVMQLTSMILCSGLTALTIVLWVGTGIALIYTGAEGAGVLECIGRAILDFAIGMIPIGVFLGVYRLKKDGNWMSRASSATGASGAMSLLLFSIFMIL